MRRTRKQTREDRALAIQSLQRIFPPSDSGKCSRIWWMVVKADRLGTSRRVVLLYQCMDGVFNLSYSFARAFGYRYLENPSSFLMRGCGFSPGTEIANHLNTLLYGGECRITASVP